MNIKYTGRYFNNWPKNTQVYQLHASLQVSSKAVSFHHPLSRALAGLCLHMERFDLHMGSNEFNVRERPGMLEMVEPAMRTTVLVAQVHAGMWRRNGYAVIDQVRRNPIL